MSYAIRIKEALDNAEENIAWFARFADSKLEKKLRIVQQQIGLAAADKNDGSLRLLHIWEQQIIEARLLKYDQHPPLDELTDMEKDIAEMEAFEAAVEKRNKVLTQKLPEQRPEIQYTDDKPAIEVTQLKLF